LAVAAHHALGVRVREWDVRVLATDISGRALEEARRAWYPDHQVRSVARVDQERFLERDGDGFRVSDTIRDTVAFRAHNLRDGLAARRFGRFDVICCRNVLCHFGARVCESSLRVLHDRLRHDGVLLVGHRDPVDHPERFFAPVEGASAQAWSPASED